MQPLRLQGEETRGVQSPIPNTLSNANGLVHFVGERNTAFPFCHEDPDWTRVVRLRTGTAEWYVQVSLLSLKLYTNHFSSFRITQLALHRRYWQAYTTASSTSAMAMRKPAGRGNCMVRSCLESRTPFLWPTIYCCSMRFFILHAVFYVVCSRPR